MGDKVLLNHQRVMVDQTCLPCTAAPTPVSVPSSFATRLSTLLDQPLAPLAPLFGPPAL